jgi:hypothetical protein
MPSNSNGKSARFVPNKQPLKDDIDTFIYKWNATYPIDRWWRERHKIAFNSPEHRVVSFLDIYIEWQEEQLVSKAREATMKNAEYTPGDWLLAREFGDTKMEIEDFEKLDLSQFDDKK